MSFTETIKRRFREDWYQKNKFLKTYGVILGLLLAFIYISINLGISHQQVDTWGATFDHTNETHFGSVEILYGRGAGSGELTGCFKNYWTKDHQLIAAIGRNFCYTSPHGSGFDDHIGFALFGIIFVIPVLLLFSSLLYLATVKMKSRWFLHIVLIPLDLIILILWYCLIPWIWISFKIPFTQAPGRG